MWRDFISTKAVHLDRKSQNNTDNLIVLLSVTFFFLFALLLKYFVCNLGVYQHLPHLERILVTFLVFVHGRDAHFIIGEEDEKKTDEDDKISSDPKYV